MCATRILPCMPASASAAPLRRGDAAPGSVAAGAAARGCCACRQRSRRRDPCPTPPVAALQRGLLRRHGAAARPSEGGRVRLRRGARYRQGRRHGRLRRRRVVLRECRERQQRGPRALEGVLAPRGRRWLLHRDSQRRRGGLRDARARHLWGCVLLQRPEQQ